MVKEDILPLGSVVQIQGNTKKLMIIARGMLVNLENGQFYFDYGAVLYPEGLLGEDVFYFNHENIQNICVKGAELQEEELAKDTIFRAYQENINRRADLDKQGEDW